MDIILIAAITLDGYIAKKSDEVVSWSKDLKLFKKQTMGSTVIMGSNTQKTLATELKGRESIVVHKDDKPEKVLSKVKAERCFIIGGGMTNSKFINYMTHLYLTPHPLLFGSGVKLFRSANIDLNLKLIEKVAVIEDDGIYQFQYIVER